MRDRESHSKRQGSAHPDNQASYPSTTNKYTGQEQSVERLKSCIADLKKLATSKVKKTSANAYNMNSNSNLNLGNQNARYESRHNAGYHQGYQRDGQRGASHQQVTQSSHGGYEGARASAAADKQRHGTKQ